MLVRTDRILANLGYCSRREAADFIKLHRVCSGNNRILNASEKVSITTLRIDDCLPDHPDGILLVLNKPAGYVCTHALSEGKSVYDLLPQQWRMRNPVLSTVGRLDKDTTGVLLFTDRTTLIHRFSSSKKRVEKVYRVIVDQPIESWHPELFASGDLLLYGETRPCLPARLIITGNCTAEVTLTEGRYHQVKRMFGALDYTVTKLHRSRFATFTIEDLQEGMWYEVPLQTVLPLP